MTNPSLTPDNQEKQLKLLTTLVSDTLSEKQDESTRKIFFFIKRSLRQCNLDGQIQESDILIEAYLRVRKKIESGEFVQNMPAYLNRFAFNIIREKIKEQKKTDNLYTHLINNNHGISDITSGIDETDNYKINILVKAIEELKSEEFELIKLRIVKGLSWQEISEYLSYIKRQKISPTTLRKRGERALKRLRKSYFSVEKICILEAGGKP